MKAHRHAREGDAEDLADLLEVGIDRSVPVVIESALPIPVPCPLLPCLRQFREAVDGRLDNLGHDNLLKRKRPGAVAGPEWCVRRSEEHTSELQSLMRISYAVFCSKQKKADLPHTS